MAALGTPDKHGDDTATEATVLKELFGFEHPVTLDEVIRHLSAFASAPGGFAERDAIDRAVRELLAAGLVNHTNDDFVLPTRAAYKFAELVGFRP